MWAVFSKSLLLYTNSERLVKYLHEGNHEAVVTR